jgi:hypothetical protein
MSKIEKITVSPTAEYEIMFHVTAESHEEAEWWVKQAVTILDHHTKDLQLQGQDGGAVCSGHIQGREPVLMVPYKDVRLHVATAFAALITAPITLEAILEIVDSHVHSKYGRKL